MTNRVDGLHSWSTNKLKQAILNFVKEAQSPQVHGVIHNLIDVGNFAQVHTLLQNAISRLGNTLPQLFIDLATDEMNHLGAKLGPHVGIATLAKAATPTFDPTNTRAATLMHNARLDFIQNMSDEQLANIRQILATGFSTGQGVRQTARQLVDSIGLTQSQLAAVANYRTLLEAGSADALTRQLRDRRFDPTVQNAADGNTSLTSDQIDRMVERYRQQMLNFRAENIARTETLSILSQARQEAMQQTLEQSGIDPSQVSRTWRTTKDNRARDSHTAMDGQTVAFDEPFTSGLGNELRYPGDPEAPAEDRIQCRCTFTYNVNPDQQAEAA